MKKAIKIIDLAEKQLKDEILPKHIRYSDEDLYFDGIAYYDEQGNNDLLDILAMTNSSLTHLNDEVEIIEDEEDKKIEKIKEILRIDDLIPPYGENEYKMWKNIIIQQNKITEIIDRLNEMDKGE